MSKHVHMYMHTYIDNHIDTYPHIHMHAYIIDQFLETDWYLFYNDWYPGIGHRELFDFKALKLN